MVELIFDNIDEARAKYNQLIEYNCYNELWLIHIEHERCKIMTMEPMPDPGRLIVDSWKRTKKPPGGGHAKVWYNKGWIWIDISRHDQQYLYGIPSWVDHPMTTELIRVPLSDVKLWGGRNIAKTRDYIEKLLKNNP